MDKQTELIRMSDGKELLIHTWLPAESIKGVLQLVHGSCEHIGRYEDFASRMAANGYVVFGWDLRGHGATARNKEDLGYFGDVEGWRLMLKDIHEVNQHIRAKHSAEKLVLVGHSMGSFLARHYTLEYGNTIDGLIAIGTSHNPRALLMLGKCLAELDIRLKGKKNRSQLLYSMSYGSFNKGFSPPRTQQDWLSSDEKVVDDFLKDELCGFVLTSSGFRDMFEGLLAISDRKKQALHPKGLPTLLLAGEEDPVGARGKQVLKAYNSYKRAGATNIKMKLYKGMRHEVLNELNKAEVYKDILAWLETI